MKLKKYRETIKKIGPVEASNQLNCNHSTYWRWENSKTKPSAANIEVIKKWSNKIVSVSDFY